LKQGSEVDQLLEEELALMAGEMPLQRMFGIKFLSGELLSLDNDLFVRAQGNDPILIVLNDAQVGHNVVAQALLAAIGHLCLSEVNYFSVPSFFHTF
jgi:hypothetical protein